MWKPIKPTMWERCDGFSVAAHGADGWTAARPEGFMLRDGTAENHIRRFPSADKAMSFVDRYHRVRDTV